MKIMFFDTETTGLGKESADDTDPSQPMAVQLGMKLDDVNRQERAAMNFMIAPDGWTVEKGASDITGITTEIAADFGATLIPSMELFFDLLSIADMVVAHNASFDIRVMRRMTKVWSEWTGEPYFDPFAGKTLICTKNATTNILKLRPKRPGTKYKWPKLSECMKFFFNEEIEGAHDALVDVRACAKVFYHLMDEGYFK